MTPYSAYPCVRLNLIDELIMFRSRENVIVPSLLCSLRQASDGAGKTHNQLKNGHVENEHVDHWILGVIV